MSSIRLSSIEIAALIQDEGNSEALDDAVESPVTSGFDDEMRLLL